MVAVSPFTPLKQPDWRWGNSSLLLTTFSDLSSSQFCTPELRILRYHTVPLIPLCHSDPHCVPSPLISTLIPLRFCSWLTATLTALLSKFLVLLISCPLCHLSHPLPQSHPGLCHLSTMATSGSLLYPAAYLIAPLSCSYLILSTSKTKLNPLLKPTPTAILLSQLRLLTEPHPSRPVDQSLYFSSKPISMASLVVQW